MEETFEEELQKYARFAYNSIERDKSLKTPENLKLVVSKALSEGDLLTAYHAAKDYGDREKILEIANLGLNPQKTLDDVLNNDSGYIALFDFDFKPKKDKGVSMIMSYSKKENFKEEDIEILKKEYAKVALQIGVDLEDESLIRKAIDIVFKQDQLLPSYLAAEAIQDEELLEKIKKRITDIDDIYTIASLAVRDSDKETLDKILHETSIGKRGRFEDFDCALWIISKVKNGHLNYTPEGNIDELRKVIISNAEKKDFFFDYPRWSRLRHKPETYRTANQLAKDFLPKLFDRDWNKELNKHGALVRLDDIGEDIVKMIEKYGTKKTRDIIEKTINAKHEPYTYEGFVDKEVPKYWAVNYVLDAFIKYPKGAKEEFKRELKQGKCCDNIIANARKIEETREAEEIGTKSILSRFIDYFKKKR